MKEHERLLDLLEKYLCYLGYKEESVKTFISDVTEIVALKLADSNVVIKNKKGKGHQTHIAITGKTISFFYNANDFEKMDCESVDQIDVKLINGNIEALAKHRLDIKDAEIKLINSHVSIGKRTQKQIQLSKQISKNSDDFNTLRDLLVPNDLFILLRIEANNIVCIGINQSFYENDILPDYDTFFNANTYIRLSDVYEDISDNTEFDKAFSIYTEKSTDTGAVCYFCGCTLAQYMKSLPDSYCNNDIQRGIVKNEYLDRIVQTIIRNDSIPTITLVADGISVINDGQTLKLEQYRILDGLQRTFRINEIWKCMNFFEEIEDKDELLSYSRIKLARELSADLKEHDCNASVFFEVLNEYRNNGSIERFWKYYNSNVQWFEIWENLSPEDETKKMLILNAGHKEMDIRHQLELLFLNMLPELNKMCKDNHVIGIIRNKDKTDMLYSKERKKGEYYFSHIISAAISYSDKKAVTTNVKLVKGIQQDKREDIDNNTVKKIMKFMFDLDAALEASYGEVGTKWIGRETVLVGMFAALGEVSDDVDAFSLLLSNIDGLNLQTYEAAKNDNIEVSKVNVGNVTKTAVNRAILDLINKKINSIDWNNYFGGNE